MSGRLDGLRVAALMDDDFEQVELTEPMQALRDEGADVKIISPAQGKVQGMNHDEKADTFPVDIPLDQADPSQFDAALLPGGALNADHLRMSKKAVSFVRSMFDAGKPMAVICHAPWMLVEADIVRGRRLTSYPSIQTDIRNAGGEWVDEEVVTDRGLVTSRKPADIPAFNRKMIEEFGEGTHAQRMAGAGAGATAGAASRSHR
jgi:protease I